MQPSYGGAVTLPVAMVCGESANVDSDLQDCALAARLPQSCKIASTFGIAQLMKRDGQFAAHLFSIDYKTALVVLERTASCGPPWIRRC